MENTTNFGLKVYEGDDLFNPLTVENYNTNAIDGAMKENEDAGVQTATELLSGTVHAITRAKPDASVFRFTAVSRFTAGDTFTVDGVQVSALLTSGEQLPDGAFIIGSEVLAVLKGTLMTVFTTMSTVATAKNAEKLGGELPAYYATATAVTEAQETATAAGNLASQVNDNLASLDTSVRNNYRIARVVENVTVSDIASGAEKSISVNIGGTLPNADYHVIFENINSNRFTWNIKNKTADGFTLYVRNVSNATGIFIANALVFRKF